MAREARETREDSRARDCSNLHPGQTHPASRRHSLRGRRSQSRGRRLERRLTPPRQVKVIAQVLDAPRLSPDLVGHHLRQVSVMILILPLTPFSLRLLTNLTADQISQQS